MEMSEKEMPSYYSIIPATVRYDHNLKANEKLMYGEITALASKNGYCWAENRYFAELYDVHKITISKWLKNLEDNGYIKTELKYVYGTKQVSKRLIYINDTPISQIAKGYKSNDYDPVSQNAKEELSTTSNNNTRDIKTLSSDSTRAPYKEIIEYLNEKTGRQYKHAAKLNQRVIKARFNEGYDINDFKSVIDKKTAEWNNDAKMKSFLRPETLFGTKFDRYLNEDLEAKSEPWLVGNNESDPLWDVSDL